MNDEKNNDPKISFEDLDAIAIATGPLKIRRKNGGTGNTNCIAKSAKINK